ncbi:MAG: hypothetical protein RIR10_414, partial [Planctomycetota bacterium]
RPEPLPFSRTSAVPPGTSFEDVPLDSASADETALDEPALDVAFLGAPPLDVPPFFSPLFDWPPPDGTPPDGTPSVVPPSDVPPTPCRHAITIHPFCAPVRFVRLSFATREMHATSPASASALADSRCSHPSLSPPRLKETTATIRARSKVWQKVS